MDWAIPTRATEWNHIKIIGKSTREQINELLQ